MESLDGDVDDVDDRPEGDASRVRVRVTAKGSNVPQPIEVFDDLLDRYKIAHRLLSNLRENHFKYPTGVQAHGIPILLEVSS
jgi:ATP-dependent RNA helicase DDX52/ROK1